MFTDYVTNYTLHTRHLECTFLKKFLGKDAVPLLKYALDCFLNRLVRRCVVVVVVMFVAATTRRRSLTSLRLETISDGFAGSEGRRGAPPPSAARGGWRHAGGVVIRATT